MVLASRSEVKRGEWERFQNRGFEVKPCGSVAYKLAQVAAGLVDATWTLVPKNEWDVVAGVALVQGRRGAHRGAGGARSDLQSGEPPDGRDAGPSTQPGCHDPSRDQSLVKSTKISAKNPVKRLDNRGVRPYNLLALTADEC